MALDCSTCKRPHFVYVAGCFESPPLDTIRGLSKHSFEPSADWWKRNHTFEQNAVAVKSSEVFIICTDCPVDNYPFAGSHMLAGVARDSGVPVITFGARQLTSFAGTHITAFNELVDKLRYMCCTHSYRDE
jgi:hypothetical protein